MPGFTITGFNHVAYPISTRQNTLPFYRDVLGLDVIPSMVDNSNVIWTQMADGSMVHPIEATEPGRPGGFHVAFGVESVPDTVRSLEAGGQEITSNGERHDGQEFAFILDPDGNRLEFATRNDRKAHGRVCDVWGMTMEGGGGPSRHRAAGAPIRLMSVEHVGLPITDRKRSVAFYRDVVGLKVIPSMVDSETITWLGLPNGAMLHLIETERGNPSSYHGGFEVPDFDAAVETMTELGVNRIRTGVRHDGRRALHFDDPDGNHVELVSNDPPRHGHRIADEWGYTRDA